MTCWSWRCLSNNQISICVGLGLVNGYCQYGIHIDHEMIIDSSNNIIIYYKERERERVNRNGS